MIKPKEMRLLLWLQRWERETGRAATLAELQEHTPGSWSKTGVERALDALTREGCLTGRRVSNQGHRMLARLLAPIPEPDTRRREIERTLHELDRFRDLLSALMMETQ